MLDLSNFGENSVSEVNYMFSECANLVQVDLGNFFSEKISDVSHMFDGCEKLNTIDMRKFDMSNVESFEGFFEGTPHDGSFIYNETFFDELVSLIPGSWEKIKERKS